MLYSPLTRYIADKIFLCHRFIYYHYLRSLYYYSVTLTLHSFHITSHLIYKFFFYSIFCSNIPPHIFCVHFFVLDMLPHMQQHIPPFIICSKISSPLLQIKYYVLNYWHYAGQLIFPYPVFNEHVM